MKGTLVVLAVLGLAFSAFGGTVTIENNLGGWDIWYICISPSEDDSWGEDWLGEETLFDGESKTFRVADGMYDICLTDEDGDEYIQYFVDVSGSYTWNVTLTDLGEAYMDEFSMGESTVVGSSPITIYNDTGDYDFWYIYANPSTSSDWGNDRLESGILYTGDEFTFYVEGGMEYDICCEDVDGDTYTFWEVWVGDDGLYLSVDMGDLD